MAQAKNGDTVEVHYTGMFHDSTVFETTICHDATEFTIGEGQRILGFEQAVVGMSPGDWKTTKIPADEAYGPYRKELALEVHRNQLPANVKPQVGEQLHASQSNDYKFTVTVIQASESSATLDANHPLARKDLTFDAQLVEIV